VISYSFYFSEQACLLEWQDLSTGVHRSVYLSGTIEDEIRT